MKVPIHFDPVLCLRGINTKESTQRDKQQDITTIDKILFIFIQKLNWTVIYLLDFQCSKLYIIVQEVDILTLLECYHYNM